jgi:hypothetical protein
MIPATRCQIHLEGRLMPCTHRRRIHNKGCHHRLLEYIEEKQLASVEAFIPIALERSRPSDSYSPDYKYGSTQIPHQMAFSCQTVTSVQPSHLYLPLPKASTPSMAMPPLGTLQHRSSIDRHSNQRTPRLDSSNS